MIEFPKSYHNCVLFLKSKFPEYQLNITSEVRHGIALFDVMEITIGESSIDMIVNFGLLSVQGNRSDLLRFICDNSPVSWTTKLMSYMDLITALYLKVLYPEFDLDVGQIHNLYFDKSDFSLNALSYIEHQLKRVLSMARVILDIHLGSYLSGVFCGYSRLGDALTHRKIQGVIVGSLTIYIKKVVNDTLVESLVKIIRELFEECRQKGGPSLGKIKINIFGDYMPCRMGHNLGSKALLSHKFCINIKERT